MNFEEKTLSSKTVFEGRIINVHYDEIELPNGNKAMREVVEHSGGVCVAPLNDNDELLFVRQYRYPYHRELLELPAGKLEKGEDHLKAGIRELEEECGVVADKIIPLGAIYPTVAYCSEIIYLYGAVGLHETKQNLDEDEFLDIIKIPLEKAVEMVMQGEISDAKTVGLVLKIAKLKDEGKI